LMDRLPKNLGPDVCRLSEMYTEDESAAWSEDGEQMIVSEKFVNNETL
jgi:hypothetical protein